MSSKSESPESTNEGSTGNEALTVFQRCLDWLKERYGNYEFFLERDIVWTCQQWLRKEHREGRSPFRVFCEWPLIFTNGQKTWVDLALIDEIDIIRLAVEFKYEPDHKREQDFQSRKFKQEVVGWGYDGMVQPLETCKRIAAESLAPVLLFLLIDEGSFYLNRKQHEGLTWEQWKCGGNAPRTVHVLSRTYHS